MAINITSKSAQVNNLYNILNQPNLDIQVAQLQNLINDILTLTQLTLQRNDAGALLSRNVTNDAAADFIAAAITGTTITGSSFVGPITGASSVTKSSPASGGFGLLTRGSVSATTTFAGGATENIAVQVPAGAVIIGTLLRVDTIIVMGGGGATWSAAYNTGSTQSICTGQAKTKNTKVATMYDPNVDTPIATAATDITITPNVGSLTSGAITAVVFYEYLTNLTSL